MKLAYSQTSGKHVCLFVCLFLLNCPDLADYFTGDINMSFGKVVQDTVYTPFSKLLSSWTYML